MHGIIAVVTLQVTIDMSGRIAEARPVQFATLGAIQQATDVKSIAQPFVTSATDAVSAWEYDPPARKSVTFLMSVVIRPPVPAAGAEILGDEMYVDGSLEPVRKVPAAYPFLAKTRRIQGVIIVEATIDPDGRVLDARVLRAIPWLDQAALDAVAQWEFDAQALKSNGERRNVLTEFMLNFVLR